MPSPVHDYDPAQAPDAAGECLALPLAPDEVTHSHRPAKPRPIRPCPQTRILGDANDAPRSAPATAAFCGST